MAMEIFKLFGSIYVDSKDAENSIQKTSDKTETLGTKMASGVKTAAKWGAALTAAAAGVGASMIASAKSTAANLDTVDKGAKRMKVSAEYYQSLAHASELCGVSMDVMEKAAKKLEGTDLNFDDALEQVMSYGTEAERTAAAVDLFGESIAYQLTPMLTESTESFEAMKQEAKDLGLVMSNDTVAAGATLNDSFTKIGEVAGSVGTKIGVALMPYVQNILDWVLEHMPEIQQFISDAVEGITGFIEGLIGFVDDLGIDWAALWEGAKKVIEAVAPVIRAIIKGVVIVVQGAIDLINTFINAFNNYNKAVEKNGVDGYWVETEAGSYWVPVAGNNQTNNPNNAGTVKNSTSSMTKGTSSGVKASRNASTMATGGVLERGQIGFLEGDGAEAVVPLEKNTGWIAKVAEGMSGALGGAEVAAKLDRLIELMERGSQIYLDGKTLVGGIVEDMTAAVADRAILQGRIS